MKTDRNGNTKLKKRIAKTLLLVSAGLLSAAMPLQAQDATPPTAAPATSTAAAPSAAPSAAAAPASANTAVAALAPTIDATDKANVDDTDGIAATVNDESISDFELRQRVALFVAVNNLQPSADDLKKIRIARLQDLEDEKIRLQEAQKKSITVSPTEVDKAVNALLDQNQINIDQLRGVLAQAGSSELALRSQITAQIAWQKTVQNEYADRVNITPAQIDAEYMRQVDGANRPHFAVSEIFLPVSNPQADAAVFKNAQDIIEQIKGGARFDAMAHQVSQNPAAARGGAIGWVFDGQLAPELNAALEKMTTGDLSSPIRSAGGYFILYLQGRQEPAGTKITAIPTAATDPNASLALARLLLPLGVNPPKEYTDGAMQAAMQIRAAFNGCDALKVLSEKMKGSVYMDLGTMKPADLAPDIQKALATTHPGETTLPVLSDAGVELIARCDKRIEEQHVFAVPTRDQVEAELFDQQISALAQRYMRDLKRDADVEVR